MKADVTVLVEGGEARHSIRGVLSRSAERSRISTWKRIKGHLLEAGWSLMAFFSGLVLASVYGATALFLQKQPLWFCVYTTLAMALIVAFSMGLSTGVRTIVMVMLPSLCSAHGRNFLLFLFVTMLLSGPLTNTLENAERAAASLLCGAELAANQTQELMQRAAMPLFSALDKFTQISSDARAVAGRVHNFIRALTDSVQHVARTLRNVLHFLVDIGDACNAKLGSPYRKCRLVFTEARADCSDLLGEDFNFLCDIMNGFLPLCNIARVGEFFCIIPSYIANLLKKHLAAPTIAAFERMKREFEFNITTSVTFDLEANSSRSLQQVSQDIMEDVSSDLELVQTLSEMLKYGGLVLLSCSLLRAVQYRLRYLRELDFDNVYITSQFKALDQQVASGGGAPVLPITRKEAKTYITPLSLHLSSCERRVVMVGVVSVLRHLVTGGLLVMLDFLVFWMLDQVHHQVTGDVVARAPVIMGVQVNGSGFASDIYRDLVSSFNFLQGGNITVISRKCLLEPSEPNYNSCFILGFLLGLALLVSVIGGLIQRFRRLVCAEYHPERELERIHFLREQILDQRRTEGEALRRSAVRIQADQERGVRGRGLLQTLVLWLPGGAHLSYLLGVSPSVTCLACEEMMTSEYDVVTCDIPQCSSLYCRPCFHSLGNTCVFCVPSLTSQEDCEEAELDSGDYKQQSFWSAALNSSHFTDLHLRSMMKRRGTMEKQRGLTECSKVQEMRADVCMDSELSEADMTYENYPGSDESDSDASFHTTSSTISRHQDDALVTVIIHQTDPQNPPGPEP
ncbi:DC-STAMP domain-containing protein 2-like [Echeneis naucrates]|uniref:DC-STAMP domain-containing protein 2-like n=1 Tax=Echeneis naucrates TaxID=173247 RepID=UPI0011145F2C|nr:DC-STAMP domain-containing protein 2-like [Echeneis naucrates]